MRSPVRNGRSAVPQSFLSLLFPLLSLLLVCVVLLQTGCGGAEARKLKYLERGQAYLADRNYEKARVELRNVLQIDPRNAEALFLLGQVAERSGDLRTAVGLYRATIDIEPHHNRAIAHLAKMFVFAGAPDRALELVLPALERGEDSDLLAVRAAARRRADDVQGALTDAQRAVELNADNDNAIALLASIYRQTGDHQAALALLNGALERRPDNSELRQVLAQLYLQLGDRAAAESELRAVIRLNPTEQRYRYDLALFLLSEKQVGKAEMVLRDAVAAEPDATEPKLALAEFLATQRSRELAERELKAFIAAEPDRGDLRLGLGRFYERGGESALAESVYRELIERDSDSIAASAARNRIAAIQIGAGKLDQAQSLLAEVLEDNPRDNDALVLRANVALARHDPSAAVSDLRAVLRDQPTSTVILRALARAHWQNGEPALAEENYRRAVELNPGDIDARLELGQFLAQRGETQRAVTLLERVVNDAPQNVAARESLFRAQVSAQQWDDAHRTAENIKLLRPDQALGFYFAGLAEEGRGRLDDSRREYQRALELQPDGAEPLAALVRVLLQQGKSDAAVARLQSVIDGYPQNAVARNLLGEVYLAQKKPNDALREFEQAIARASGWWVPYRGAALAQLAAGNFDAGIRAYERGLRAAVADSGKAALWIDLAAVYERQQRPNDAIRSYEELLKLDPGSTLAVNNLAMLLVTYRSDQASLDRARDLTARFASATDPALLNTQGWVKYKRGEFEAALPLLAQAVEKAPDSPLMRFHLGMAQYRVGQLTDARGNLEHALQSDNPFVGVDEARATLEQLKKKSG